MLQRFYHLSLLANLPQYAVHLVKMVQTLRNNPRDLVQAAVCRASCTVRAVALLVQGVRAERHTQESFMLVDSRSRSKVT